MNTAVEINPMLQLVHDQFGNEFGLSPQMKTTIAMTDKWLGGVNSTRAPTHIDKLDMVKTFVRSANMEDCQSIISELIERVSDEVGSAFYLEEAFSELGEHISTACNCGKCDSCVAARSDEHQDRVRDGQLCDEA